MQIQDIIKNINRLKSFCDSYSNLNLLIVTKGQSKNIIQILIKMGIYEFGENKIQEIIEKYDFEKQVKIHFIGSIQSNKCEPIVQHCSYIHSLDRLSLVDKFQKAESKIGVRRKYFVQVNLAREAQKGGVFEEDLGKFLDYAKDKLDIIGLMILPPKEEDPRSYFQILRNLSQNYGLFELSMGMSQDYRIAAEEGSTYIRIGASIFKDISIG